MRDTMTSRGPDDAGLIQRRNYTFAHRRLAIRDLAGGKQPWLSPDGRFVLVYNGEIYNDDQLRGELQQLGFRFCTRCDTEVLMAAWMAWGQSCVGRLRGMFAFGIADLVEDKWWLVRDRCGVKPLYFSQIGDDFVFASSIKAIVCHPGFSARPNLVAIRHYLSTLRLTLDQRTVFENVFTVRPAEMIACSEDRLNYDTYWSPPQAATGEMPFDLAVDELEVRLRESISLRLKSDVPIGMMLSGGVDSNTLASLTLAESGRTMAGQCGGGVESADETDTSPNESDFRHAASYAAKLGFDFDEVRVDQGSYRETWSNLLDEYATPLATPTDVIIYHVARSLKQRVGVAFSGEGADEAFCGYTVPHWSGSDFDRANALQRMQANEAEAVRASLKMQYGRDHFVSPSDHYLATNGLIPRNCQAALFQKDVWAAADGHRAVEDYYDRLFDVQGDRPMVQKYAHILFRLNLESLLGRLDGATMAASLEARVPYTDHLVVEQAFRVPHSFKIDVSPLESQPWRSSLELSQRGSLRPKRLLRSVAARWMDPEMAERPKMSFPTPLASWLHTDWKSWMATTLKQSSFAREIFRSEALDELKKLPAALSMWNWPILNVAMWGDLYF